MRSLINWEPFKEMDRFFDDDWFPTIIPIRRLEVPAVDVSEANNKVIVETALPGINPDNIDVHIEDNVLTIKGKEESEKESKSKQYYRKEIHKGAFERSIRLPGNVKSNQAKAEYKNGVLRIEIPKLEESKKTKVNIKVEK